MASQMPSTIQQIYENYLQRREGLLRALTEGEPVVPSCPCPEQAPPLGAEPSPRSPRAQTHRSCIGSAIRRARTSAW